MFGLIRGVWVWLISWWCLGRGVQAHVTAWAACMDYIEELLSADSLVKLKAVRPNWQGRDIREIAEYVAEYQLVETLKAVGLIIKNGTNALLDLLAPTQRMRSSDWVSSAGE